MMNLFKNLFKSKKPAGLVQLDVHSQSYVLRQRMHEKSLRHGDKVVADIGPVRLRKDAADYKEPHIYFCAMRDVSIKKKLKKGDGGPLPGTASIVGIVAPKEFESGLFMLKNVTLFSNGTLQLIANENTEFESLEEGMFMPDLPF